MVLFAGHKRSGYEDEGKPDLEDGGNDDDNHENVNSDESLRSTEGTSEEDNNDEDEGEEDDEANANPLRLKFTLRDMDLQ